jgi:hypothetical protein
MKIYLFLFLFCPVACLYAQMTDDFEDADLSAEPEWYGMPGAFTTVNGELRSNYSTLNSLFYISTPLTGVQNEWRLDFRLLFNTSSVNYVDFVLVSDSANLTLMKNGYFIRLGGSADEVSLFKIKNGAESKIIDGADGVLNSSNNQYSLFIQRRDDTFFLKRVKPTGQVLNEGWVKDRDIVNSSFIGIRIRQSTASFTNRHYFDNLYAGPIIRDSVPPVWDSLQVKGRRQLRCVFNESCDSASLADKLNYKILQGNKNPQSVVAETSGKAALLLFDSSFEVNKILTLGIQNIKDRSGNMMPGESKAFYDSKPDTAGKFDLLITELFPDPDPQVALPMAEYVEITNVSGKFIRLTGCRIHDPTAFKMMPDLVLAPDSILVLKNIPSLNNAEDRIWITNQLGQEVHLVHYTDRWYGDDVKKQGGYSLEMIDYTQPCLGMDNWKASVDKKGGTPGYLNSVKAALPRDTAAPFLNVISIVNDSLLDFVFSEPVDSLSLLSMWFKVDGTTAIFKLKSVSLSGSTVRWLFPFVPDKQLVYQIRFEGVKDCSGNRQKETMINIQWPSTSVKGNMVINEILFNPRSGGSDFIEIYNHSRFAFDLSRHFLADVDAGGLLKGIYQISASGVIMKPFEYAIISQDTANIRKEYHVNGRDALILQVKQMPSMPDDQGTIILLNIHNEFIDSLSYTREWHFPLLSDENGVSLERLSFSMQSNSSHNWHSAASVAGFATPGYRNSQFVLPYQPDDYFKVQSKTFSPDEDGFEDVMVLRYALPSPDYAASVMIYDIQGRLVKQLVNNSTLGTEGIITWDGVDDFSGKSPIGIYIVWIECVHPDGRRIRQKLTVVVAGRL